MSIDDLLDGDVIGRAADLERPPAPAQLLMPAPIHRLVTMEELERPSPQTGHPDPEFPEIDTRDPLYMPRFLVRRWGSEKFFGSAYYKLWEAEAGRGERLADPKPSAAKKRR